MDLLTLIIILVVVGVVLYLVQRAPFIDATIKSIIFWAVLVFVCIWLLGQFGLLDSVKSIRIGR
jgi:hypothetical protein